MHSDTNPATLPTDPRSPKQSLGQDPKEDDSKGRPKVQKVMDDERTSKQSHPEEQRQLPHMKEVHICVS